MAKSLTFTTAEHDVLGGRAKILRVRQSGDIWQFRMWIGEEGKYVRKSLKTKDLEVAMKQAEEEYLKIYSDIASGRKIFSITLRELVDLYIKWREKDVKIGRDNGGITEGRLVTIKSQLKHFLDYKDENMNVSELDANTYYDYASFRKLKSMARDVTIRNEISTINHMFRMAYRQGYCHLQELYFRKVKVDVSQEMKRRGIFTLDEYESLWKFMRGWVSKNQCLDDAERQERLLVRDCVLIASNTMLRMGELWQLKWGDIESIYETRDADGITRYLVTINVRHETSKVKRDRTVVSRGGEYFLRLKNRANCTGNEDYVFCSVDGKSIFLRQKYYLYWKMLMNGISLDYKKRNITWYSLRHFGITCRLKAGVDIYKLAEIAGTSVATIQAHYGHIDREMMKQAALKNIRLDEAGLIEVGRDD